MHVLNKSSFLRACSVPGTRLGGLWGPNPPSGNSVSVDSNPSSAVYSVTLGNGLIFLSFTAFACEMKMRICTSLSL